MTRIKTVDVVGGKGSSLLNFVDRDLFKYTCTCSTSFERCMLWEIVLMVSILDIFLYGSTTGNPSGVIQPTGLPVLLTLLAHFLNHSLIPWAPVKRLLMASKVNLAK